MKEKYENIVKIPNLNLHTLGSILDFVYTGLCGVDDENVCRLLEGADYVHITGINRCVC